MMDFVTDGSVTEQISCDITERSAEVSKQSNHSKIHTCNNCLRTYKSPATLRKHEKICAHTISPKLLKKLKKSSTINAHENEQNLVKVRGQGMDHLVRKSVQKQAKATSKKKNKLKTEKKEPRSYLLQEADQESRWQLIQYKVNEILDETLNFSQAVTLTQPLQPSLLAFRWNCLHASKETSLSLWQIAKCRNDDETVIVQHSDLPVVEATPEDCAVSGEEEAKLDSQNEVKKLDSMSKPVLSQYVESYRQKGITLSKLKSKLFIDSDHMSRDGLDKDSVMVGNLLFSDITIRASDGDIAGHKVMLANRYPAIVKFLEFHNTVVLQQLSKHDIVKWLENIYSYDRDMDLSCTSTTVIEQFLELASNWYHGGPSDPHLGSCDCSDCVSTRSCLQTSPKTHKTQSDIEARLSRISDTIEKVVSENQLSELSPDSTEGTRPVLKDITVKKINKSEDKNVSAYSLAKLNKKRRKIDSRRQPLLNLATFKPSPLLSTVTFSHEVPSESLEPDDIVLLQEPDVQLVETKDLF